MTSSMNGWLFRLAVGAGYDIRAGSQILAERRAAKETRT